MGGGVAVASSGASLLSREGLLFQHSGSMFLVGIGGGRLGSVGEGPGNNGESLGSVEEKECEIWRKTGECWEWTVHHCRSGS